MTLRGGRSGAPVRIHVAPARGVGSPATRDQLEHAVTAGGGVLSSLGDADALVWPDWEDAGGLRDALAAAPAVTWVQLVTAGVDALRPVLDPRWAWSSAKGAYSLPIAEYVMAALLSSVRDLTGYARTRTWSPRPAGTLRGARVTVVGGGGVASALLSLMAPFGCRTTVVRRSGEPVAGAEAVLRPSQLHEVAARTDALVLALALTAETHHLVDADLLARLPPGARLVNVSRGAHVDTDALADALAGGRLAGAVLDVTDPEPLPPESPLWDLDNCVITPHVACTPELATPHLLQRVQDNVVRRREGRPLLGVVDPLLGY